MEGALSHLHVCSSVAPSSGIPRQNRPVFSASSNSVDGFSCRRAGNVQQSKSSSAPMKPSSRNKISSMVSSRRAGGGLSTVPFMLSGFGRFPTHRHFDFRRQGWDFQAPRSSGDGRERQLWGFSPQGRWKLGSSLWVFFVSVAAVVQLHPLFGFQLRPWGCWELSKVEPSRTSWTRKAAAQEKIAWAMLNEPSAFAPKVWTTEISGWYRQSSQFFF